VYFYTLLSHLMKKRGVMPCYRFTVTFDTFDPSFTYQGQFYIKSDARIQYSGYKKLLETKGAKIIGLAHHAVLEEISADEYARQTEQLEPAKMIPDMENVPSIDYLVSKSVELQKEAAGCEDPKLKQAAKGTSTFLNLVRKLQDIWKPKPTKH